MCDTYIGASKGYRDVRPHDFDGDLSELEEGNEQRDDDEQLKEDCEDCECGGADSECDCQFEYDDEMDDDESERSYDGSDADYYYELKEQREERKREKLEERKEKDREVELVRTKEEEVRRAYKLLRKAKKEHNTIPVESLAGQGFKLFCSDYINHSPNGLNAVKLVNFYHKDDMDDGAGHSRLGKQEPSNETGMLYGDVYLEGSAFCDFGPFRPPSRASRKPVKVKSCDGKYELLFKFIGNGYLKLKVSHEMVYMRSYNFNPPAPPSSAPEVFEFVGIWRDPEKEETESQERMANTRRSPSPGETFFEMSHPMGAYNVQW